jgi:ABC-type antimicrobial peptide transport system permease subunit
MSFPSALARKAIADVTRRKGRTVLVILGNSATSSEALGTFLLTSGHLPGPGEIVMECSDSTIQAFSLGDTTTVDVSSGTANLRIVGLARTPGDATQQGALAYMRPDVLQHLAHLRGPNSLLVKLRAVNEQTLLQASPAIAQYLDTHGVQQFMSSAQIIADPTQSLVSGVLNAIRVVSLIALLLAQNFATTVALNLGPFTLAPWVIVVSIAVGLALPLSGAVFLSVQATTASIGATLDERAHTYSSDVSIAIRPQSYQQLLNLLSQVPNVERIERRLTQTVQVQDQKLDLIGLEPDTQLYQHQLVAGRWLAANEANTVVLSDVAAGSLGLRVGDTLTVVSDLNKNLGSQAVGVAYTSIRGLNALDNAPSDQASNLMVRARDRSPAAVDKLAKDLYAALTRVGIEPSITTLQQQIQQNQGPAQIVYTIFDLVAVIVALVGILGLFSTLSSSVLERHLEIGILRSLGASGGRVAFVFLTEGLAFAILAWLIGAILGVPGAYGLVTMLSRQLVPLDCFFNPLLILATLLFLLLIVTLASLGPALTASHLRIRELLRYE